VRKFARLEPCCVTRQYRTRRACIAPQCEPVAQQISNPEIGSVRNDLHGPVPLVGLDFASAVIERGMVLETNVREGGPVQRPARPRGLVDKSVHSDPVRPANHRRRESRGPRRDGSADLQVRCKHGRAEVTRGLPCSRSLANGSGSGKDSDLHARGEAVRADLNSVQAKLHSPRQSEQRQLTRAAVAIDQGGVGNTTRSIDGHLYAC
jgi:hypothetical protein